MNTVEVLQAAKDRIIERGWCKNVLVDDDGRVCAVGALYDGTVENMYGNSDFISSHHKEIMDAEFFLTKCSPPVPGAPWGDIVSYNNFSTTTVNDVLNVFDQAILKAKEEGN